MHGFIPRTPSFYLSRALRRTASASRPKYNGQTQGKENSVFWTGGDRIPAGGETFRTRPDRPWGPPSLLYNVNRVFPGGKVAGRGVDHPPPSSAEVKETVELYLYFP